MGVGPNMTWPPLISQARWLPRLTHAAADDPHGVAADWTVAAATAGVSSAHPTAAVTDIVVWRKKPIAETPLGRCASDYDCRGSCHRVCRNSGLFSQGGWGSSPQALPHRHPSAA